MAQRVTQDAALTLGEGNPKQRVTQVAALTLGEGAPNQRVTQVAVLTLIDVAASPSAGTITPVIFCST